MTGITWEVLMNKERKLTF